MTTKKKKKKLTWRDRRDKPDAPKPPALDREKLNERIGGLLVGQTYVYAHKGRGTGYGTNADSPVEAIEMLLSTADLIAASSGRSLSEYLEAGLGLSVGDAEEHAEAIHRLVYNKRASFEEGFDVSLGIAV